MANMTTQREQREKRRQSRLRELHGQLRSGSLVVRQMTPEERARYPASEPGSGESEMGTAPAAERRLRQARELAE
jgi:hypothetical protein